jgi:hypothetical protein
MEQFGKEGLILLDAFLKEHGGFFSSYQQASSLAKQVKKSLASRPNGHLDENDCERLYQASFEIIHDCACVELWLDNKPTTATNYLRTFKNEILCVGALTRATQTLETNLASAQRHLDRLDFIAAKSAFADALAPSSLRSLYLDCGEKANLKDLSLYAYDRNRDSLAQMERQEKDIERLDKEWAHFLEARRSSLARSFDQIATYERDREVLESNPGTFYGLYAKLECLKEIRSDFSRSAALKTDVDAALDLEIAKAILWVRNLPEVPQPPIQVQSPGAEDSLQALEVDRDRLLAAKETIQRSGLGPYESYRTLPQKLLEEVVRPRDASVFERAMLNLERFRLLETDYEKLSRQIEALSRKIEDRRALIRGLFRRLNEAISNSAVLKAQMMDRDNAHLTLQLGENLKQSEAECDQIRRSASFKSISHEPDFRKMVQDQIEEHQKAIDVASKYVSRLSTSSQKGLVTLVFIVERLKNLL